MGNSQAVVITVFIVKNEKCKVVIKNKTKRVYSSDTFREILRSSYDGMKDAKTIQTCVSHSVERRDKVLIDNNETMSLANKIFLAKTTGLDILISLNQVEQTMLHLVL